MSVLCVVQDEQIEERTPERKRKRSILFWTVGYVEKYTA